MQKNKLNLHIYGIHLLNPYKTVVSHLKRCWRSNGRFLVICFSQLIYHISLSDRNSSRRGRPSPEPASGGVSCICYFDSLFPERLSNPFPPDSTVAVPKITPRITYQMSVYILSCVFLDVFRHQELFREC